MVRQLTRDEAIEFAEAGEWRSWTPAQRGAFQLQQRRLCMDFASFHEGVEALLGRPVWTHEFASSDALIAEWKGLNDAPTFEEIIALLPQEKLIVVEVPESGEGGA